jgi:single-strand DNA-binding protein
VAGETIITVCGNLTADPEVRYTQQGLAVANFTIASTPRTFDRQKNEWVDGEALFLRASVWRDFAENLANSLQKGMRVIATGRLKQRNYEDREGNKRTAMELEIDEIGPSLRYATALVQRVQRDGRTRQQETPFQQQQADAWATPQEYADQMGQQPQQQSEQLPPWQTPGSQQQEPWTTPGASGPGAYGDDTPF